MKQPARMTGVDKLVHIACDGLHGRYWYRDATAQIDYVAWLEGWDRNEFAGVLATSSPRCSVLRNIRMSLHFMRFRNYRVFPMVGIRTAVRQFVNGEGVKGQKTFAFYQNLSGRTDAVTLDVWMSHALGVKQKAFDRIATRVKATERIAATGRRLGIEPAEAQASIWTGYRTRRGLNHSPFSVASEYFTVRADGWSIQGCNI